LTWGTGLDADSLVLDIGGVLVPEPVSTALLALPLVALGLLRRERRRAP
jgi:hypothetical protein